MTDEDSINDFDQGEESESSGSLVTIELLCPVKVIYHGPVY